MIDTMRRENEGDPRSSAGRWAVGAACLLAAAAVGPIGCGGRGIEMPTGSRGAVRMLNAEDFRATAAERTAAQARAEAEAEAEAAAGVAEGDRGDDLLPDDLLPPDLADPDVAPDAGPAAVSDIEDRVEPLTGPVERALEPGETRTVAGLVGQINGRPIYVDAFFAPIENQLVNIARETDWPTFVRVTEEIIRKRLEFVVDSELLLAEARSLLTEEEQAGARHMLTRIREQVVLGHGGSEQMADQALREEFGVGLDEMVEQWHRELLIRDKILADLENSVRVSWRDIERHYRNHESDFNPPESIRLRLIRVTRPTPEAIAEIEAQLAGRTPFEVVAERYGSYRPEEGGLMNPTPLPDGLAEARLTAWEEVDEAARELAVGEFAGPFEVPGRVPSAIWVQVAAYESGEGVPLVEAQNEIEQAIRDERLLAKQEEYFERLRARGSYDRIEDMTFRLLAVAVERWAPPREDPAP